MSPRKTKRHEVWAVYRTRGGALVSEVYLKSFRFRWQARFHARGLYGDPRRPVGLAGRDESTDGRPVIADYEVRR